MKDHEFRDFINDVRDTAVKFKDSQQLRSRLISVIKPFLEEHTDYISFFKRNINKTTLKDKND